MSKLIRRLSFTKKHKTEKKEVQTFNHIKTNSIFSFMKALKGIPIYDKMLSPNELEKEQIRLCYNSLLSLLNKKFSKHKNTDSVYNIKQMNKTLIKAYLRLELLKQNSTLNPEENLNK